MGLRIDLKPYEGFLVNGALIRNGPRRADFLVESECKFLRESEIIRDGDVETPADRLCHTLQVLYLMEDNASVRELFLRQVDVVLKRMPWAADHLRSIQTALDGGRYYQALKYGRALKQQEERRLKEEPETIPASPEPLDHPADQ